MPQEQDEHALSARKRTNSPLPWLISKVQRNPPEEHSCSYKSLSVTARGKICSSGIMGPLFFSGTVTQMNYLQMLQDTVVLAIMTLDNADVMLFQHYRGPPHSTVNVHQYLDQTFPKGWIRPAGLIDWPSHSPDISPMHFYFGEVINNFIFTKIPATFAEMKDLIMEAFVTIDRNKDLCAEECQSEDGTLHQSEWSSI